MNHSETRVCRRNRCCSPRHTRPATRNVHQGECFPRSRKPSPLAGTSKTLNKQNNAFRAVGCGFGLVITQPRRGREAGTAPAPSGEEAKGIQTALTRTPRMPAPKQIEQQSTAGRFATVDSFAQKQCTTPSLLLQPPEHQLTISSNQKVRVTYSSPLPFSRKHR